MRKIIKRTLALILAISITPVSYFSKAILPVSANENNKNFVYGDLNNDSSVNVIDMLLLKSHIQEENHSNINISAADVDGDNTLSYKDISELASYLIGTIDIFTAELNIDSDSDGLCDYLEELLQTNPKTKDTDGDGLSDYDEIYLCGTNPTIKDTDSTGKNDNLKDSDKDGISNIDEIKSSTSPNKCDSDNDGLTDYDEIYNYNSDPTNNDTDNDGITDNSEIINGTNPLSSVTENIPDNERIFQKDISQKDSILSDINVSNNLYNCSLSVSAAGNIFESLSVRESAYTHFLKNESIIGKIIDISYQENLKFEKLKINFSIDDDNIEKYCIFKYHSDARMILPVETEYNGNEISFTDTGCGTYCLVNMDIWISSIAGTQYHTMSEESVGSSPSDPYAPTDIYMLLFLTEKNLDIIREELLEASKIILKRYHDNNSDARIYFVNYMGEMVSVKNDRYYIEYNDISQNDDLLNNTIKRSGFAKELQSTDNYLFLKGFKEITSQAYNYNKKDDAIDTIFEVASQESNINRNKHCVVVDNAFCPVFKSSKLDKDYDITTINSINKFKAENQVNLSFIYNYSNLNEDYYFQMASKDYVFKFIASELCDIITERAIAQNQQVAAYNYNTGLFSVIELDSPISAKWIDAANGKYDDYYLKEQRFPDSDGDGVYDFEEIDMSLFKVDEQGNLIFPTINDICQKYSISTKPLDFVSNYFKNTLNLGDMKVIPIISNPNTPDSDNDGLYDQVARYVDIYDGSLEKYKTIKVVPPDPDPLKANAPAGIWDEHCKQQASGKRVAHKLEGTYGVDILSLIGSAGLTFEVDDKYIAIHSKEEQWQKVFGFTDFYDSVFKFATNENMDRLKVEYKSQSPYDDEPINHILWLWREDYLNIGTGGEIGIYYDDDDNGLWTVEKFRLPMTLETYNYYGENHIENIFCWSPYEKQWWITGFNPELREPDVKDVLLLGSVDYSEYPNMYSDLKNTASKRDFLIFDDESYTVWIVWWNTEKYPLT